MSVRARSTPGHAAGLMIAVTGRSAMLRHADNGMTPGVIVSSFMSGSADLARLFSPLNSFAARARAACF